jgi:hypothetical protein
MLGVLELAAFLTGFTPSAQVDRPSRDATTLLGSFAIDDDPACGGVMHPGYAIDTGETAIAASFTRGVVVIDARGEVVAWTGGYACTDAGDDIVTLAAGDAQLDAPVIVVVTRRRASTAVALLQVRGRRLDTLFAGEVTRVDGGSLRAGSVALGPGQLVYVDPDGVAAVLVYDRDAHRYVRRRDGVRGRASQNPQVSPASSRAVLIATRHENATTAESAAGLSSSASIRRYSSVMRARGSSAS